MSEMKRLNEMVIRSSEGFLNFTEDQYQISGNGEIEVPIKVERGFWICPYCKQGVEYLTINDCIFWGCGRRVKFSQGKVSERCGNVMCKHKEDKFFKGDA